MMTISKDHNLKSETTFGVDAWAAYYTVITSIYDIQSIPSLIKQYKDHFILGGGSNILFTKNFPGLVLKNEYKGITVIDENEDEIILKVNSGEVWNDLVMYCVNHNYGGIENLSLIPGTVGAAPIQNIGAYGVEVKDVITAVEAMNLSNGTFHIYSHSECEFGYRDSIFKRQLKNQVFIESVTIRLSKRNHKLHLQYGTIEETLKAKGITNPSIKDVSDAVIDIRRSKLPDPQVLGNAGSFFKNPVISRDLFLTLPHSSEMPHYNVGDQEVKIPAAWLIEKCGWKGYKANGTGVHEKQALVLVNYGEASGKQIFDLSDKIIQHIKEAFSISLEREVNVF